MNEKELNRYMAAWEGWKEITVCTTASASVIGYDPLLAHKKILYKTNIPDYIGDLSMCFVRLIPKLRAEIDEDTFSDILTEWIDEYILHSPPSVPAFHLCVAIHDFLEAFAMMQMEYNKGV